MNDILVVLQQQYRNRQWLQAFAQDPNAFIKDWFDAYARENEVISPFLPPKLFIYHIFHV